VGTLTPQKTRTGGWHEETTNDLGISFNILYSYYWCDSYQLRTEQSCTSHLDRHWVNRDFRGPADSNLHPYSHRYSHPNADSNKNTDKITYPHTNQNGKTDNDTD